MLLLHGNGVILPNGYHAYSSSIVGTVRALFSGRRRAAQGRRRGGAGAAQGRRRGGASLKIQGGASSLTYVIIICMMSHGRNQEE